MMKKSILSLCIGIVFFCIAVYPVGAQQSFQKYGYVEIPESNENTYLDLGIMSYNDVQGVLELTVSITCNYDGLRKAGFDNGFENIVFQTQHGEARFKALCTCNANSTDKMLLTNPYGIPGSPDLTDKSYALIHTLLLEKVTVRDASTGKKKDITKHIGLEPRRIPIIVKK